MPYIFDFLLVSLQLVGGTSPLKLDKELSTSDKLKAYEKKIKDIRHQRKTSSILGAKSAREKQPYSKTHLSLESALQKKMSPRENFKISEELKKYPEMREGLYYKLKNKKTQPIPLLSKSHERIQPSSADDTLRRIERGSARLSGQSTSREIKDDY